MGVIGAGVALGVMGALSPSLASVENTNNGVPRLFFELEDPNGGVGSGVLLDSNGREIKRESQHKVNSDSSSVINNSLPDGADIGFTLRRPTSPETVRRENVVPQVPSVVSAPVPINGNNERSSNDRQIEFILEKPSSVPIPPSIPTRRNNNVVADSLEPAKIGEPVPGRFVLSDDDDVSSQVIASSDTVPIPERKPSNVTRLNDGNFIKWNSEPVISNVASSDNFPIPGRKPIVPTLVAESSTPEVSINTTNVASSVLNDTNMGVASYPPVPGMKPEIPSQVASTNPVIESSLDAPSTIEGFTPIPGIKPLNRVNPREHEEILRVINMSKPEQIAQRDAGESEKVVISGVPETGRFIPSYEISSNDSSNDTFVDTNTNPEANLDVAVSEGEIQGPVIGGSLISGNLRPDEYAPETLRGLEGQLHHDASLVVSNDNEVMSGDSLENRTYGYTFNEEEVEQLRTGSYSLSQRDNRFVEASLKRRGLAYHDERVAYLRVIAENPKYFEAMMGASEHNRNVSFIDLASTIGIEMGMTFERSGVGSFDQGITQMSKGAVIDSITYELSVHGHENSSYLKFIREITGAGDKKDGDLIEHVADYLEDKAKLDDVYDKIVYSENIFYATSNYLAQMSNTARMNLKLGGVENPTEVQKSVLSHAMYNMGPNTSFAESVGESIKAGGEGYSVFEAIVDSADAIPSYATADYYRRTSELAQVLRQPGVLEYILTGESHNSERFEGREGYIRSAFNILPTYQEPIIVQVERKPDYNEIYAVENDVAINDGNSSEVSNISPIIHEGYRSISVTTNDGGLTSIIDQDVSSVEQSSSNDNDVLGNLASYRTRQSNNNNYPGFSQKEVQIAEYLMSLNSEKRNQAMANPEFKRILNLYKDKLAA